MELKAVNPATGKTIRTYRAHADGEVDTIIEAAATAFQEWREVPLTRRAECLNRAAAVLRDRRETYARLMAEEMGKPIRDGRAEADKCAWVCEYYAANAGRFLAPETVETDAAKSYVTYQPLGAVLAIMPWNFPFWQVFRFAAPALMAGNTGLLKHAANVPGCSLAIEDVFTRAGFPRDVFRSLLIGSDRVERVIENPRVRAVTLTGSTPAGRAVAAAAGRMLKKTVLELGGSDPYIVLADADLERAVAACVTGRLINSGQSCIAAKRFVVVDSLRERFEARTVETMGEARLGDPLDGSVTVGPLARRDLRDDLHRQVVDSVKAGARCLLGGEIPAGPGAFYPPTVLTDVEPGMPAYDEEVFGPVAAIIPVRDENHAVRVANDTVFGLGAAVFTRDVARGESLAETAVQAGSCFVNSFVRSDPRLPFGGIKESGYGRELSHYGIREFVNVKTVYIA